MPASVGPVVIWACVAAFLLCLIGALLALFEIWAPKSRATKRWLLSGVLFSAVGAVGTYAARQFNDPVGNGQAGNAQASNIQVAANGGGAAAVPARPNPPPPTAPPPGSAVTPSVESADTAPSAAVREWAQILGPRPDFQSAISATYPTCVASLGRGDADAVLNADADACGRELDRFHFDIILPVYNRKAPYERNLERQDEALRSRCSEPETQPRCDFVASEMRRLRGEQWDQFVTLDRRVRDDTTRCQRRRCRPQT